jgi:hypothetical protein
MANAVDHLLNDVVNLYIQAVDYRRIPAPVGARIQRRLATVAEFRWYCAKFLLHWLEQPDPRPSSRDPKRI